MAMLKKLLGGTALVCLISGSVAVTLDTAHARSYGVVFQQPQSGPRPIVSSFTFDTVDTDFNLIDPIWHRRIQAIFTDQLADAGVIHIGNDDNASGFFTRTLHLVSDPNGPCFAPAEAARAPERMQPVPETFAAH